MTAPGQAATPGQAGLKLAFENWFGGEGYDDQGRFDMDEMEFAFEAGAEAQRDLDAAAPARTGAPDQLTVHIARDEFHLWMTGEGYDWDDDSYQAEAFAAGFTRSDALWKAYGPQAAPRFVTCDHSPAELGRTMSGEPQAAPGPDAATLRDGIEQLLDELKTSAAATHPSRKSEVEFEVIRKLRAILGQPERAASTQDRTGQ